MGPLAGYLPTLDGWRAVAIAGVLVAHGGLAAFEPSGPFASADAFAMTRLGARGVDLFFAISGFLITSRLLEEYRTTGRIGLGRFYLRRAFRILPPFLVFLAVVAVGTRCGLWTISGADLFTDLTFTRNYLPSDLGSYFTAHLWSLCVEEHFYLLWPGVLVAVGPRRSLPWALGLGAGLAVWAVVEFRLELVARLIPGVGYYGRTDICLNNLIFSSALAVAIEFHPRVARRVFPPWAVWPILLALLLVIVRPPPLSRPTEAALFAALVGATVLNPNSLVGRCLEWRSVRWFGRISYSLYLWQQLFLVPGPLADVPLRRLPWNLLAALGCAVASYRLVERPLIRLGHRIAQPTSQGRPAPGRVSAPDARPAAVSGRVPGDAGSGPTTREHMP